AAGRPGARDRDDAVSRARAAFDWESQFRLALDPERARTMHAESSSAHPATGEPCCTMCGPRFCALRISRDWKQSAK
ncbi:MAG: phosphomethylpyrimidine synthase ThiC, partial [Verrucomicrobia bacterium]|nr:phosphomethylpyrimidine synthase ThiC [Verrucomicrobiota bacterium]